jgi:hypothetical protein
MTVIAESRVLPESLDETYQRIRELWPANDGSRGKSRPRLAHSVVKRSCAVAIGALLARMLVSQGGQI